VVPRDIVRERHLDIVRERHLDIVRESHRNRLENSLPPSAFCHLCLSTKV